MLRDTPRLSEEGHSTDALGQGPAIETLTETIRALASPACVALYGSWGTGKTTVLRQVADRCLQWGWVPVWFDPWEYDRAPSALPGLVQAMVQAARSESSTPDVVHKLQSLGQGLLRSLANLGYQAGVRFVGTSLAESLVQPHESAQLRLPSGQISASDWNVDLVQEAKKKFGELTADLLKATEPTLGAPGWTQTVEPRRIVVFLDDLDRCMPDRMLEVIESVKLLLCGSENSHATFVFALDRQLVGEAVRARLPGSSAYAGENYLEKIFDVSLEVPPVPAMDGVASYMKRVVSGAGWDLNEMCKPFGGPRVVANSLSGEALANPRVIKRTLNRLYLLVRSEHRRSAILEALAGAPGKQKNSRRGQYLSWLAGSERYRQFRQFSRRASHAEWTILLGGIFGDATVHGEAAKISKLPGIGAYLATLGFDQPLGKDGGRDGEAQFQVNAWCGYRADSHRYSLRWFDDLMRSGGL